MTSFFTLAEVYKARCEGKAKPLADAEEDKVAAFLRSEHIMGAPLDRRTGELARKLMREHPECGKPTDAVHLATAILMNVDELHTFDASDLLKLSGKVARRDGEMLTICAPYVPEPKLPLDGGKVADMPTE